MITAKKLSSGYFLIRGQGPCSYAQVDRWPPRFEEIVASAHPEASPTFLREALRFVENNPAPKEEP